MSSERKMFIGRESEREREKRLKSDCRYILNSGFDPASFSPDKKK